MPIRKEEIPGIALRQNQDQQQQRGLIQLPSAHQHHFNNPLKMPKKSSLDKKQRDLIRRYLIWCYKTTKEELDRIDRYYTQYSVDKIILKELRSAKEYGVVHFPEYMKQVGEFADYMEKKKSNADQKKYNSPTQKILTDNYLYLSKRFAAIEKAVVYFLGSKALEEIRQLYEQEMTTRILQAREHS